MSNLRKTFVQAGDSASIDAFARWRSSDPFTVLEYSQVENNQPLSTDEELTGSATATYDSDASTTDMTVTIASGDKVIRQTHEYAHYQPGKSLLIFITFLFADADSSIRQSVGYFDGEDGIFLRLDGETIQMVKRTTASGSTLDTTVDQANWNIDKLDGTGDSGITLDEYSVQIWFCDIEWLGVGRVRTGFVIHGIPVYVHQFTHANDSFYSVYMARATLPLRWEIERIGALGGADGTMKQICGTVISEGGYNPRGIIHSVPQTSPVSIGTTLLPIIAIRLKAANLKAYLDVVGFSVTATAADDIIMGLVLRPTVTGGSWIDHSTGSIAQFNTTATSYSGGQVIWTDTSSRQSRETGLSGIEFAQRITADHLTDTADNLVLVARARTGSSNVIGSMSWREVY